MTTIRSSFFISGAAIALIIIAPLVALAAWGEPSQAPTGGNVDPPINTGTQNQNKNGGLSVTGFAVFGSTALNGNTYLKTGVTGSIYRYLNFGADYDVNGDVIASTIGESGYGIRDKDGTLEFKNLGGSWQSIQAILWELCGGPCGGGGEALDPPVSFSVNKGGTDQSIVGGAGSTAVTWGAEAFDTNNNFNTSTGRFTPTVAGKYILTVSVPPVTFGACGAGNGGYVRIRKNGSNSAAMNVILGNGTYNSGLQPLTAIVDANGTSDYFDVAAQITCPSTYVINGSASDGARFAGALLAPQSGGGGGGTGSIPIYFHTYQSPAMPEYSAGSAYYLACSAADGAAFCGIHGSMYVSHTCKNIGANAPVGINYSDSKWMFDDAYVPGGPNQGIDTLVCANGVSGAFLGSQN